MHGFHLDWRCCPPESLHRYCCVRERAWNTAELLELLHVRAQGLTFHRLIAEAADAVLHAETAAPGKDSSEGSSHCYSSTKILVGTCLTQQMGTYGTLFIANGKASVSWPCVSSNFDCPEPHCSQSDTACPKLPNKLQIDGRKVTSTCVAVHARFLINASRCMHASVQLFGAMMRESGTYDEHMLKAIQRIRGMPGMPVHVFYRESDPVSLLP